MFYVGMLFTDESPKYDLWADAKEWEQGNNVHSSRLLKAESFLMQDNLIYENGSLDVPAIVMLFQASKFLDTVHTYLERQVVGYINEQLQRSNLRQIRDSKWKSDFDLANYLTGDADQFLFSLLSSCELMNDWVAPISSYILANHPEVASFVEGDKTRFNADNWLEFLIRVRGVEKLEDYGFVVDEEEGLVEWKEDAGSIDIWDIKVSEREFIDCVNYLPSNIEEVNFAIKSACTLINYLNHDQFCGESLYRAKLSANTEEDIQKIVDESFAKLSEPEEESGPIFLSRKFQILYQNKRFTEIALVDVAAPAELDERLHLEWWVLEILPQIDGQARRALETLSETLASYRYKGKQLEEWKERAFHLGNFLIHQRNVMQWYYCRVKNVDDESLMDSVLFLQEKRHLFNFTKEESRSLWMDQKLVKDALDKGEKLSELSFDADGFESENEAISKLTPILDKFNLTIVPKETPVNRITIENPEMQDNGWTFYSFLKQQEKKDSLKSGKKALEELKKLWGESNVKIKKIYKGPTDVKAEVISSEPVVEEESVYTKELKEDAALQKWQGTTLYQDFLKLLGGNPKCKPEQIAIALNKSPETNTKLLKKIGREFCKNLKPPLDPCFPNEHYDKLGAMVVILGRAFNEINQPKIPYKRSKTDTEPIKATEQDVERGYAEVDKNVKGEMETIQVPVKKIGEIVYSTNPNLNSAEKTAAVNDFRKDAEGRDLDKTFLKHIKKIVGNKKDKYQPWVEKAAALKGRNPIKQNSKWDSSKVAIALCENHNKEDNSDQ